MVFRTNVQVFGEVWWLQQNFGIFSTRQGTGNWDFHAEDKSFAKDTELPGMHRIHLYPQGGNKSYKLHSLSFSCKLADSVIQGTRRLWLWNLCQDSTRIAFLAPRAFDIAFRVTRILWFQCPVWMLTQGRWADRGRLGGNDAEANSSVFAPASQGSSRGLTSAGEMQLRPATLRYTTGVSKLKPAGCSGRTRKFGRKLNCKLLWTPQPCNRTNGTAWNNMKHREAW